MAAIKREKREVDQLADKQIAVPGTQRARVLPSVRWSEESKTRLDLFREPLADISCIHF